MTKRANELLRLERKIISTSDLLNSINAGPLYDYDVAKIETNLKSFLEDPEIVSISLNEINSDINLIYDKPDFDPNHTIQKFVDVRYNGEKIGTITVLFSTHSLYDNLKTTTRDLLVSFLLITVFVATFLHFVIEKLTQPISNLTEAAAEIADGNLNKKIQIQSQDEIGILAKSFQKMQDSIKEKLNVLKLENDQREKTLLRSRGQQAAILKITSQRYYNWEWADITNMITETAVKAINTDRASIWLADATEKMVINENTFLRKENKHEKGKKVNIAKYPTYFNAIKNLSFIAATDASNDYRTSELYNNYLKINHIISKLDVPIKIKGKIIGTFSIESTDRKRYWTADECVFAERISDQIANFMIELERRKITQALQDSEKRFVLLTKNIQNVVIYQMISDRANNRKFTYVSPNIEKINNISPEEILADSTCLYKQVDKDHLEQMITIEKEALKNLSTMDFEFKAHVPDKGIHWFHVISTPRVNKEDEIIWDGVQIDITERVRVEQYRTNINRINETIFNSNNVNHLFDNIVDAMLEMYDCNRSWAVYGFDPKKSSMEITKIRTKPDWGIDASEELLQDVESIDQLSEKIKNNVAIGLYSSESPYVFDSLQKHYDVKSMLFTKINPKIGKKWLLGIVQCDRERFWTKEEKMLLKEINSKVTNSLNILLYSEELQKTEKYISNIIDSMPSAIIGVDIQGNITQWNRESLHQTGLSPQEVYGMPLEKALPHLTEEKNKIKEAITRKKKLVYTKRPRKYNNQVQYENITVYPLRGKKIEGAVIRIDNVTDRVNMEEMMIQSEKMLSVGGLAAGMAHEINNPLAGIIQNSQVLKNRMINNNPVNLRTCKKYGIEFEMVRNYFIDRKIDKLINNIMESGSRASDIVKNMLSFSRMDSEKKIYCDLSQLIDKTLALASSDYDLKKKYDFRRIKIIRNYHSNVSEVNCSPGKIQQVFLNILKNGAEAMTEKTYIDSQPTFEINYYQKENWAVVEISDNGPGIDIDIQKRIFEPFYTTKDPGIGTGLGLSISYFIITENHKGEMGVESFPGEGSKFFIRLPLE